MRRVLFIILLIFLFFVTMKGGIVLEALEAKEETSQTTEERPERKKVDIRNFRNPFASLLPQKKPEEAKRTRTTDRPKAEKVAPPDFTIYGLIWNTDLPQAIVNERVVKIGDVINEAEILNITKEGITIKYRNEEFFIESQLSVTAQDINKDLKKDRRYGR